MGGLFRSEPMLFARLLMTDESAHDTIRALGDFGMFHFVEVEGSAQSEQFMAYKKRVAICTAWEKRLGEFYKAMEKNGVVIPGPEVRPVPVPGDVVAGVKTFVEAVEQELEHHMDYRKQFETLLNEAKEKKTVLEICRDTLLHHRPGDREDKSEGTGKFGSFDERKEVPDVEMKNNQKKGSSEERKTPLLKEDDRTDDQKVNSLNGVIPSLKQSMFERMLFRVLRGNVICTFHDIKEPITDPASGESVKKSVFQLIFFGSKFFRRIQKICQFFGASIYQVPSDKSEFKSYLAEIERNINEYASVLRKTKEEIVTLLNGVAFEPNTTNSPIVNWMHAIKMERMICDALKKCDTSKKKVITAEGWVPEDCKQSLKDCLEQAAHSQAEKAILQFPDAPGSPPTYFKTNKFTSSFQGIVDTYGVPRYQEVNPGLFTIITFPFLYGIMYGDIGHSSTQLIFAIWMIWNEDKFLAQQKNKTIGEIFGMLFGGRYLILLMATFALYCGLIYNDCFSIPLHLFSSHWTYVDNDEYATFDKSGIYPFGIDPSWYHTENELTFFNSLKMKLSVTLGVVQMLFGIFLGLANNIFWGDSLSIFFEFIPRFLFMFCTFGYMVIIILFKFAKDWDQSDLDPPNLVQTMISMFLSPGKVESDKKLYDGQENIQLLLLVIALISVPFMLFPQPCIVNAQHKRQAVGGYGEVKHSDEDDHDDHIGEEKEEKEGSFRHTGAVHVKEKPKKAAGGHGGGHGHGGDGEYSFSDHMITQGIHTIEFVLGAVSNTASYLRLWALSLAHSQLAAVFWDKMIMQYGISTGSPIMTFVGLAVWVGATGGVLLAMDSLECFLHALRLHWVEFQNKFYHADGYPFKPFDLKSIDEEGED